MFVRSRISLVLGLLLVATACTGGRGGGGSGDSNRAPVAHDQDVTTDEEVSLEILITGEDDDGDEAVLVFDIVDPPARGTLELLEVEGDDDDSADDDDDDEGVTSALYRYTPELDFFGEDSFTFQVIDKDEEPS
jgi:hypothetical protein